MRIKKKTRIVISALLLTVLIGMCFDQTAWAYFDRGPVGVSVGKSSVTLEVGQSESVSVSFSPSSSSQLPGCGMAECPQICGDKNCFDENGECKCNGSTYQTYYAFAQTVSSNTSVATASYQNGVVVVTGHSAGTATITVTASLRQFQSTSTSFTVTVNQQPQTQKPQTGDASSSGNSQSGGNQSGNSQSGNSSSQNTGVTVNPVGGDDSTDDPGNGQVDDSLNSMEESNKKDTD